MSHEFPSMGTDHYLTIRGNFYAEQGAGHYRQVELYLPSSRGTFSEDIEVTAQRYLEELESGVRKTRMAIGSTGKPKATRYSRSGLTLTALNPVSDPGVIAESDDLI